MKFPVLMKNSLNGITVAFYSRIGAVVVDGADSCFEIGQVYPDLWFIDELVEDDGPKIWESV